MLNHLLSQDIQLSLIKEMEIRAAKIPGVISLAQGIPYFDTPLTIKRRVIDAIERGLTAQYSLTQGLPQLREVIEERLAQEGILADFEKEIIVTAGATQAIMACLLALLNPGEEVLLASPSYASYPQMIKVAKAKPVFFNLQEEKGWALDIEILKSKISSKTKAILFCNPNNPTGSIFSKKDLLDLAEIAEKNNLFIISDEVYKDFIFDSQINTNDLRISTNKHSEILQNYGINKCNPSIYPTPFEERCGASSGTIYSDHSDCGKFFSLAQVPKFRDRVIRIFSFSKAYAMTGWRVGFLHSNAKLVQEILKVHDTLITCAPVASQYAALAALEGGAERWPGYCFQVYKEQRDLVCQRLDRLSKFFKYQKPQACYFMFPKILINKDSRTLALDILEKAKVALVPGIAFGPSGEGHLRISFARPTREINEAFDRIEKYFLKNVNR
jgi:aminotransferase